MDNYEIDGNIHVVPNDKDHEESEKCWCEPRLVFKDKYEVWVHKGYEELEN